MLNKKKIATLCLMAGTFFLPFGFDAVLLTAMKLTGGYWNAIILLYCLVALFAILYYFFRKNYLLMLTLFVNPFGYDALFSWTMKKTGSFMTADLIFYAIAILFFGLYFYIIKSHPFKYIIQIFDSFFLKIKTFFI